MDPYANESDALTIGGLSVENRLDRVSLYGSVDLTRDKHGLTHARALMKVLAATVAALEAEKHLPDAVAPPEQPTGPRDPFA